MADVLTLAKGIFDKLGLSKAPDNFIASPIPRNTQSKVPTATPTPTVNYPSSDIVRQRVMDFYRNQMPPSIRNTPLEDYYPAAKNLDYILSMDKKRPGAGVLGALQVFFESTGGRANSNLFGVKPMGKSGQTFKTAKDAIDYQFGPDVLGGGVANKLNILNKRNPITQDDIIGLYRSYNPEGDYLPEVLSSYEKITRR